MALQYQIIPVTPYQQNCSLLWCDETMLGAVVDPGGDLHLIRDAIKQFDVKLEKILVTHGHLDHVGAVHEFNLETGVPIEGPHEEDLFWIDMLQQQALMMSFPSNAQPFKSDRYLQQGDTISVGNETLEVRHCPGHTPGHVVFYSETARLLVAGDVLFNGSIGRTDFPRGDFETLKAAIKRELWSLPADVEFIPGHGPMSTIGHERATNPFVADSQYG